ncbi:CAP domain-containing protein [Nonomuraea rhizosphaerae]|uniref:CAP domain-containing protein n=1 Tax=Nonomuraea rhizosphaerae TaxID=2665663 RepID=UPI001C5E264E|nr:CAP domain-containing protein [Nonomuraea rhizosphaerae]
MTGTRPPLPDATSESFLAEALAEANAHRARHHAPPLALDPELVEYARSRAASRSEHPDTEAGHTGLREGTGENIFWGAASKRSPLAAGKAVAEWYDEIKGYDFGHPENVGDCGHFTQLVWKESRRMGAGRVAGEGLDFFETYIVFVFEEPGNRAGGFAENVRPA